MKLKTIIPVIVCMAMAMSIIIGGCSSSEKNSCKDRIPREKMVDVLTDIYLLEAYYMQFQSFRPGMKDSTAYYFKALFDIHKIDFQHFNQSLECYANEPEDFKAMHDEILNRMSIMQGKSKKTEEAPPEVE